MAFRVLHGLLGNKNRINTVDLKVWVKHVFTLLIWKNIFLAQRQPRDFDLFSPTLLEFHHLIRSTYKLELASLDFWVCSDQLNPLLLLLLFDRYHEMIFQVQSSKLVYKFLLLPNSLIACKVAGKRMDRGGWYVLEIPVKYEFNVDKKATWENNERCFKENWTLHVMKIYVIFFCMILNKKKKNEKSFRADFSTLLRVVLGTNFILFLVTVRFSKVSAL